MCDDVYYSIVARPAEPNLRDLCALLSMIPTEQSSQLCKIIIDANLRSYFCTLEEISLVGPTYRDWNTNSSCPLNRDFCLRNPEASRRADKFLHPIGQRNIGSRC